MEDLNFRTYHSYDQNFVQDGAPVVAQRLDFAGPSFTQYPMPEDINYGELHKFSTIASNIFAMRITPV